MNPIDSHLPAINAGSKNGCQGNWLYEQAHECGNRGQFELAQRYIQQAISQDPGDIRGHLFSGALYSQQGKQAMAIEAYDCGIRATFHCADQYVLRDQRAAAQRRQEARIDFVHALIPDVATAIFEQLGPFDNIGITMVSRTWRQFMLQIPLLWRSAYCWTPFLINPTFRLLHTVAEYVHKLKLFGVSNKVSKELLVLARNGRLSKVNRIELNIQDELGLALPFVFSLEQHLTSLVINESYSNGTGSGLALDILLSKCQSLQLLSLVTNRSISFDTTSTPSYKLRTLVIQGSGDLNPVFETLLSRVPQLQQFGTPNGCSSQTLTLLYQQCPRLKALHILSNLDEIALEDFNNDNMHGLGTMAVDDQVMFAPRDLRPFFVKSRTTLRSLVLNLSQVRRVLPQAWTPLVALGPFPNMKNLYYTSSDRTGTTEYMAVPLMQQCPALESIVFDHIDMISDLAIDTLMTLPRLWRLEIAHTDMSPRIQRFFEHHARKGNGSSLRRVVITYGRSLTDPVLDALANVTTLSYIGIRGSVDVTRSGLETFISKYSSHSDVRNLRLLDLRQIPRVEISHLLRAYAR
ncbi:hypothetical protein BJV82DRAFT_625277 [Fennellomyces sp. T-0311]|nr:hypothetical protein BJV82DRAFT_625277 [Fennellomyces sp. T-0311]